MSAAEIIGCAVLAWLIVGCLLMAAVADEVWNGGVQSIRKERGMPRRRAFLIAMTLMIAVAPFYTIRSAVSAVRERLK